MKTPVQFQSKMPTERDLVRASKGKNFILIYDENLNSRLEFRNWAKSFRFKFSFVAGEKLKSIEAWAAHAKRVLPALDGFSRSENVIVAIGGGSVGDFAGFLASVLKRGVGYINIPSSWLAAVDSAYGGKNGLNVNDVKNQVGTFYEPQAVFCVHELLKSQSSENLRSALGEVLKIGLLGGQKLFRDLSQAVSFDEYYLWQLLPRVVAAKYKIVNRDPFEKKGIRELLNLGHTVGHILETEHRLPHGIAVQKGLEFAADWSFQRKILKIKDYENIKSVLSKNKTEKTPPISYARFERKILQDKKVLSGGHVKFVFIKKPGLAIVERVKISELMKMTLETGWVQ